MTIIKYTSVLIETRPDAFLVRCGYCEGDGRGPCRVCGGSGKVLIRIPSDFHGRDIGILKCAYCEGDGRGPCRVCRGVGALVKCFPRVVCSYCEGDGRGPCRVCGGCGSVWIGDLKQY